MIVKTLPKMTLLVPASEHRNTDLEMGDGGDTETVTHDDDGTRADTATILSLNTGVRAEFGKCGFSFSQTRQTFLYSIFYIL